MIIVQLVDTENKDGMILCNLLNSNQFKAHY